MSKRSESRTLVNEFGEELTDGFVSELARRVQRLSAKAIDELWYNVGWINMSGREDTQKALPTDIVHSVRRSHRLAKREVVFLLLESRKGSVLRALSALEDVEHQEKKSRR